MWYYEDLTPAQRALWHNYTQLAYDLSETENYSLWWYFRTVEEGSIELYDADEVERVRGNDLLWAFLFGSGDDLPPADDLTDWKDTIRGVLDSRPPDRRPSPSQTKALEIALTQPISFIKGPPGTGKTETILNLMECIVTQGETVAMVAPNNVAVDNVVQKSGSRSKLYKRLAVLGSSEYRKKFNSRLSDDRPHFEGKTGNMARMKVTSQRVQWIRPRKKKREPHPYEMEVPFEPTIYAEDFINDRDGGFLAVTSTIHSLKKCFRDGLDYQYDYLIMDEASLTDTVVGLVAMSCARHLVLVGDLNQLEPVSQEKYDAVEEWCAKASFLQACTDRFGKEEENTVLLKEHFRCHDGIIGFCNQYIYNNELSLKPPRDELNAYYMRHFGHTSDYFPCPIRVLWFEGSYEERWENPKSPGSPESGRKYSRSNRKQIEIFLQEEWPQLRRRLERDPDLTMSILCPYRGLLHTLKDILNPSLPQGLKLHLIGEDKDTDPAQRGLTGLTIHRSQGREYDIVYFFPVDDGTWEWSWSQKKNLINVAVSRAKRELRVIASTSLMSESVQEALVGSARVIPVRRSPENDATRDQQEKEELYVQKLLDYVWSKGENWQNGDFGFHKSKVTSIFDDVLVRRKALDPKKGPSAPEACMDAALKNVLKHIDSDGAAWRVRREVPVAELAQQPGVSLPSEQLRESLWDLLADKARLNKAKEDHYLNDEDMKQIQESFRLTDETMVLLEEGSRLTDEDRNDPTPDKADTYLSPDKDGGRFDFVLYQDDTPRLIIEVDGQYHRAHKFSVPPDETHVNSLLKDLIVKDLLKAPILRGNRRQELEKLSGAHCAMLRLPIDGSTCWEVDDLRQWDEEDKDKKKTFSLEKLLRQLEAISDPSADEESSQHAGLSQAEVLQLDKDCLTQLYKGVDPVTEEPLPESSVLLQPSIRNAMSESKKALEKIVRYDSKQPKRRPEDGSVLRNPTRKDIAPDRLQRLIDAQKTLQALSQGLCPGTRPKRRLPGSDPACQERLRTCFERSARALERTVELGYYSAKAPFALSQAEWESIPAPPEPCPLRVFLARVNDRRSDPTAVEYLSTPEMQELLKDADISEEKQVLRPMGRKLGVTEKTFTDPGGEGRPYSLLCYPTRAQRHIIDLLKKFVKD